MWHSVTSPAGGVTAAARVILRDVTKKKKERPRAERRRRMRAVDKLGDAREKLARLSAGGAPERPIEVGSASVVETTALGLGCARCEGALRLTEHGAVRTEHGVLRQVKGQCKDCRTVREVWIRIAVHLPS